MILPTIVFFDASASPAQMRRRVEGERNPHLCSRRWLADGCRGLYSRGMKDIDLPKLSALRSRLIEAQTDLLLRAAEAPGLPSSNELRKIADVESAIGAVEALLESKK